MKPTWSVTGAPCSAGERTLGNIVKRECLTRTGRESREGSCGALGGSHGRESRSGEMWGRAARHSTAWQRPGGGECGAGHGPAWLEQSPGEANLTWNVFLEPGQSGPRTTSSIFFILFLTQQEPLKVSE